ncbi:MAG: vitamin B12 dependent methionine synthase [Deltaproteobacteria bacterium]|jgi:hypothetical protein|nr:vitamin B12 dependent methionine synthase [Deltaproteobacteria bacterium]
MKNIVVHLDKNDGEAKAKEYFMDICGLYRRKDISPRLLEESLTTLEDIYEHIDINAIFSRYDWNCIKGDKLILDNVTFTCPIISTIPSQDILEIIIYLLTIGDIKPTNERVLYQVYQDMWQTAFVDVARDLLQEHITKTISYETFAISDTFGPGFFGMPGSDTLKFFEVLEADKIGATIRPGGLMIPVKSYAGFFLVTNKQESLSAKDCDNCLSSKKTCSYCKSGRQMGAALEMELMKCDPYKRRNILRRLLHSMRKK